MTLRVRAKVPFIRILSVSRRLFTTLGIVITLWLSRINGVCWYLFSCLLLKLGVLKSVFVPCMHSIQTGARYRILLI